jgi:hypothetical protein
VPLHAPDTKRNTRPGALRQECLRRGKGEVEGDAAVLLLGEARGGDAEAEEPGVIPGELGLDRGEGGEVLVDELPQLVVALPGGAPHTRAGSARGRRAICQPQFKARYAIIEASRSTRASCTCSRSCSSGLLQETARVYPRHRR